MVGMTKTAPDGHVDEMHYALFSCSHWAQVCTPLLLTPLQLQTEPRLTPPPVSRQVCM